MKILVLHWGTRGGGPQMQARVGNALIAQSRDDIFLSYDIQSEVGQILQSAGPTSLVVGSQRAKGRVRILRRLVAQPFDAVKLLRFCLINSVDVVYEVMGSPLQILPRALVRLFGVRVLISVHDATRHLGEEHALMTALSAISLKLCDGVMTYSVSVEQSLRTNRRRLLKPIFTTVHGAFGSPTAYPRSLSDSADGIHTVGFFGRIEKYKGLSRLALGVAQLKRAGLPVLLSVHGRGPLDADERRLLEHAGAELHNEWVQERDIQDVIAHFDVLALPYEEASQSGVVGYALNAGVPIVCTPVSGLEEQVRLSRAGVVAASMGSQDFADALRSVLSDHVLYEELSQNGIEAARTIFSWSRVASDVFAASKSILEHPKRGLRRHA